MSELHVKRWRRFGHDRLHVNDADGNRIGWVDVRTGETVVDEADHAAFGAAIRAYWDDQNDAAAGTEQDAPSAPAARESDAPTPPSADTQPPTDAPPPAAAPPSADPAHGSAPPSSPEPYALRIEWRDLGQRRAGQAVREQAVEARQAAPVKTFAARVLGVHTDERAWRLGAKGEEKVAARLDRLPDGWHVLHAIPVGDRGADIDHLAIGPAGVFTINAKHHPDARVWVGGNTFIVNGHRHPYVRNARHEAARASKLLTAASGIEVSATGVIAVVGAHKGFTVKTQPADVHVTARKQLTPWLTRLPTTLTDDEVQAIHTAARRSDTWQ